MPVLDSQALKKDPKGSAFLRGILERSPASAPAMSGLPKASRRSEERAHEIRQRLEALLQGSPTAF